VKYAAMKTISWDDFRLVRAIAETGSLSGAGDLLGLNHSTVFRRLNALEQDAGARIFERARTGYAATPAGEEMVTIANRMFEEITDFERKVAGQDLKPSGELRVTTNDSLVAHLLTPLFGAFARNYPDIVLDVVIDNRALNLSKRDADVAIRATSEPPETLVGRRIAAICWSVYGKPPVADAPVATLSNLADKPWIGFGDALAGIGAARWMSRNLPSAKVIYRLNTVLGLSQAVEAGLGVGLLPCFIGDRTPGIQRLLPEAMEFEASLWLLTHPDLRNAARVRTFLDFMGKELNRSRGLLEGKGG
jgi:DNA-binding transcriptional LysR family regulator